jgi:DNA polymerase-3 subunit alpha
MSENSGHGSSGSWRDDEVDTTHAWKKEQGEMEEGPRQAHHAYGGLEDTLDSSGRVIKHEPGGHDHKMPVGVARSRNGNRKPMVWSSLHHHSTFSYGDGFQLPEAHVNRAVELQMPAIAMTEHGNMSSHVKLEMAAEKAGVKPIFGVELYTGGIDEDNHTQKKNHLTILAEDAEGYTNMVNLVSKSWARGFYYEPTVDGDMLHEHRRGLVVLSGCTGSLLSTSLVGGKLVPKEQASYNRGLLVAERFQRAFGDGYYLEVQAFPELEDVCRANVMKERISARTGIPLVATLDCHYTAPTESEIQKILHNVRPGEKRTLEEMERAWGYDVHLCPPLTDRLLYGKLRRTGLSRKAAIQSINNAAEIAERCNVTLPKLPEVQFPLPVGFDTAREYFRDLIKKGWYYRGIDKLGSREIIEARARLRKEMNLIESKGYENYFLVVADAVIWAKDHDVAVGPARGSAAASLVAYLLRITEVNPLIHKQLVFERFIDESRKDMPDIDLDFDAQTRWRLRDYLLGKYGECYNIGTFIYYKSRNSLDDVARVYKIPKWEVDIVKGQLIERSSGDLRASATIEDTVENFPESKKIIEKYPELKRSMDLEGNIKGFSVHAAGLVLGDVGSIAPIMERTVKDHKIQVVAIDKWDAERQGLLKMDFLGLNTMSLLWMCCQELGMSLEDLYALPLDDEKVYEGFRANDVIGVFQFEGQAVRLLNGQIKCDNFDEVCDVTSLARPGPLHNGAAEAYTAIKWRNATAERWHPAVDRIVSATKYQIIYQEQILRIVREIGDFDWTAAAYIRKIISKKLGDQEFNRQKGKFMDGAATIHERTDDPPMPRDIAERVWGSCITSGSYAFNFAHACAYGMISAWTMFFKVHHPSIFYASALATMNDDRRNTLIRDAIRHDVRIKPPSVSRSGASWSVQAHSRKPTVRMGFNQLPGIGEKMTAMILEEQSEGRLKSWDDLIKVKGIGPKKLEKILTFIEEQDPFGVFDVDRRIRAAEAALHKLRLHKPTHKSLDIPYEKGQTVAATWLGVVRNRNLRNIFEVNARMGKELDPEKVKDSDLAEFMLLICEDDEDMMRLRVDRYKYPSFKEALWGLKLDTDVVWIEGFKPHYRSARELVVRRMAVIDVSGDVGE